MKRDITDLTNANWSSLSNRLLFLRQKKTLAMFLERGAISQAEHDKSLHDLMEKMGVAGRMMTSPYGTPARGVSA